jgi:hypothetical protein
MPGGEPRASFDRAAGEPEGTDVVGASPIDGGLEGIVGNPALDDEDRGIGGGVGSEEGVEAEAGEEG